VPSGYVLDDPNNKLVGTSNGIPVYQHEHPEGAGGFADAFWEGIGGKTLMDLMAGASRTKEGAERTKEAFKGLINGLAAEPGRVWDELGATGNGMIHGDLPGFAYHAAGSIPLVGAGAQQVGVDFANGDYARGFGHGLGLLFPFMLGALPKDIGLQVKSKLNPVLQQAVDYGRRRGIPMRLSVQTGGNFARGLEGLVENDLGGSQFAARANQATTDAMAQEGQDLARRASPLPTTPADAGQAIRRTLQRDLDTEGSKLANQAHPAPMTPELAGRNVDQAFEAEIGSKGRLAATEYQKLEPIERNPANQKDVPVTGPDGGPVFNPDGSRMTEKMALPVDMRDIKDALFPLLERYLYTMDETKIRASVGLKAIKQIVQGPDFKPLSVAELDNGLLKEAARSEMPELRDISQGLAAQAVKELQQRIDATMANAAVPGYNPASGNPHPGLQALQAGRKLTAEKWGLRDLRRSFGPIEGGTEPVSIFNQLTWAKDAGVNRLREVAQVAPNLMPQVGRAFIDGGGNWETLGPETKKVLFKDPQLVQDLDRYYQYRKSVQPVLKLDEPVQVFEKLTGDRDGRVGLLERVAQRTPQELPKIGRAYVQGLLEKASRMGEWGKTLQVLNEWDALGPQTKQLLFGHRPGLAQDLDNFFVLARQTTIPANTSRTAYVTMIGSHVLTLGGGLGGLFIAGHAAGAGALAAETAHLLTNAGLARLLFSPGGTELLLKGMRMPLPRTSAQMAAAQAVTAEILRRAGKDAQPVNVQPQKQQQRPALNTFDKK
jgi:hypothetical protein